MTDRFGLLPGGGRYITPISAAQLLGRVRSSASRTCAKLASAACLTAATAAAAPVGAACSTRARRRKSSPARLRSSTEQQKRQANRREDAYAVRNAVNGEAPAPKCVARQRIGAACHDYDIGLETPSCSRDYLVK
eukprot:TRINITY_DN199_c0_g1_i1.p3 TRINITY_DN199_c0_g1~~TRINITY_DN199_c0_g1_i1.p3  ORF type:complete len:135 (-),score=11.47 TRINITY_DN199_c0_g1_i1:726-1130(-)